MSFTNSDSFLSCDWGTTSFRLTLVEMVRGDIIGGLNDNQKGIKNLYRRWNKQSNHSRKEFYLAFLKDKIKLLSRQISKDIKEIPIVISGMASSSIGLQELPYQTIPLDLENPDLRHQVISATQPFPHDIILVSGLRSSNDIMRGEEVQLLGAVDAVNTKEGCCIFPGTHSKHLFIDNKQLINFKTYMTGELFDLIANQSILQNSVSGSGKSLSKKPFRQGIQAAQDENLLNSLFKIRANNLLNNSDPENNHNFLSGLLIGTELKELTSFMNKQVTIAGTDPLLSYYTAGLDYLQIDYTIISPPASLTIRGHQWILSNLEPY